MLSGGLVRLRRLEVDDLDRTLDWMNNAEMYLTMGVFGPITKKQQEKWYERISGSQTNVVFAICQAGTHKHIGNASLFDIDYRNGNAGLTIMLPSDGDRGKGYGKEAVNLLCEYAFDYLNLNKVYCKTDNPVASKLYESVGFFREGLLRQQAYCGGEYVDKMCFGLLRDEFNKFKK